MITSSSRLILRVWHSENDLEAAIRLWGDPEVMSYVDDGQPMDAASIKQSLFYGQQHQQKYQCQHWAVELKSSGQVIGCCGFNLYEGGPDLEMVFHFTRAHWGQGYATEAGQAALTYAQTSLKPPRIVAGVHPENKASERVLLKLGFVSKGLIWFDDTQAYEPFFEWAGNPLTKTAKPQYHK